MLWYCFIADRHPGSLRVELKHVVALTKPQTYNVIEDIAADEVVVHHVHVPDTSLVSRMSSALVYATYCSRPPSTRA
jgi:hypothetical protein